MPNHIQNRLTFIGTSAEVKKIMNAIASKDEGGKAVQIDFNKIIPMPESLNLQIHSGIETWVKICTGQIDFSPLFKGLPSSPSDLFKNGDYKTLSNSMAASTAMECITGQKDGGNVKDFSDEDFDMFIKALKNVRAYGFVSWYEWALKNWGTKWNAYGQNDERNTNNTIYFETAWSCPLELICHLSRLFPKIQIDIAYADEDSGSNTGKISFKDGNAIEVYQPESQSKDGYDIYFELHPGRQDDYELKNGKYEYKDED